MLSWWYINICIYIIQFILCILQFPYTQKPNPSSVCTLAFHPNISSDSVFERYTKTHPYINSAQVKLLIFHCLLAPKREQYTIFRTCSNIIPSHTRSHSFGSTTICSHFRYLPVCFIHIYIYIYIIYINGAVTLRLPSSFKTYRLLPQQQTQK